MEPSEALEHIKKALLLSCGIATKKEARLVKDTSIDLKTFGDVAVNEALVEYFRSSGLPIVVYTEELETPKSFSSNPIYSAVGDEVDGTHNLRFGLGMLPHGGVLGISDKTDPTFKDFIASGFLEFNSGNLFYATRGRGTHVIENWAKGITESKQLETSGKKKLDDPELNVIADVYMLGDLSKNFIPFVARRGGDFRSTALHLAMVASGACDIFVLGDNCPNPRKLRTGEEIGPGYLLIREAGGVMLDWNGKDLGEERVALHEKKTFHTVIAATKELGLEFVEWTHTVPEIVDYIKRKGL